MKVSVVIPTFNRKQSLVRCLANMPRDVEVVVVDDGSTDGTAEAVKEIGHPHLVYVRRANGGPASARNTGIELASGDYVAFTDDDCLPIAPWPWPLVERLEQEGPQCAGVGGRVRPLKDGVISRYYTFHRILEPPDSCSYLVTANCVYWREVLLSVGGFDSRIRHPGGEDPCLSFDVRRLGYTLVFEPDAVVMHDYRESFSDFWKTFYRYGRGCAHVLGMERDVLLSWANEVFPLRLSPRSLWTDLTSTWRSYRDSRVPVSGRVAFLGLRGLQRIAYDAGWHRGIRDVRDYGGVPDSPSGRTKATRF